MEFKQTHSDEIILKELGKRLAHVRVESGLTQAQLAYEAGISKRTLERMEAGSSTQLSSVIRVLRALALMENLESLIPDAVPSPMRQLIDGPSRRKRASRPRTVSPEPSAAGPWQWGDES